MATAKLIMGGLGFLASKAGQLGGGFSVSKVSPAKLGWEKWGGGGWLEGVGRALWGETIPGRDKLEVVFFLKVDKDVYNDKSRVLPGREQVLIIPKAKLFAHKGQHWFSTESIVKAADLRKL